jgi:L-ascorbate metabolism protein UlaG (beta-lactamase superfamily)
MVAHRGLVKRYPHRGIPRRSRSLLHCQRILLPHSPAPTSAFESLNVELRWLGTAGFAIRHAGHTLLLDPYVTRAPLRECVFGKLTPNLDLIARYTPEADAIVDGHTHFDHALDVPAIAQTTGARVFGSRSCATLCRASRVPAPQVVDVESELAFGTVVHEVGPFRLEFYPSAHSPLLAGRVPFPGEISDCDSIPLRAHRYACGAVFAVRIVVAGHSFLHLGSAEIVETRLRAAEGSLLLLCTAGWQSSDRFAARVMRAVSPRAVILSHWDNFFAPLEQPVQALPAMEIQRLRDALRQSDPQLSIDTLPRLSWVSV